MGNRWRGYEHPELYDMINSGPGAAASDPQTAYWQNLSTELSQVDQDLSTKLSQLGTRWEGSAAESAQAGLTPLAAWATDAQTGASVMKISAEDQGQYVSDARANMPEPVEVTTPAPSGWDYAKAVGASALGIPGPAADVVAQADDHEAQESAKNAAEEKAVQTMQTYESSSTWNRDTLGTFVPPPDVVVSTPAPQGGSGVGVVGPTTSVKNVAKNGTDGGAGNGHTSIPGGGNGTSDVPSTHDQPTGTHGGGGGGGGGGGTSTPPTVNNPGTTNPSDVFVPPPGGGNPVPPGPGLPGPGLPGPGPTPGPNPVVTGGGPLPSFGNGPDNAGDIARRALPLRTGLPVESGPLGRGGLPGSGPGANGFGVAEGERLPSQVGRGGVLGGGPGEGGVVRSGPGAAGAAGRGGNGVNGPGAAGKRAEDEEDQEHYAPDYLLENDDVFGDDRRVAPTVIGE
ncbi:PPE domain-containing protein [Actinophytocola sp.]|uniref:PPE domain-containing protein n=1 Tax=Actinophytocola sp. TaxID=1872138 RepID=UPI003899C574